MPHQSMVADIERTARKLTQMGICDFLLFCPRIYLMVLTIPIQTIGITEIICRHSYGTLTWSDT